MIAWKSVHGGLSFWLSQFRCSAIAVHFGTLDITANSLASKSSAKLIASPGAFASDAVSSTYKTAEKTFGCQKYDKNFTNGNVSLTSRLL
ncbi:MAG: hypothetical protein ACKOAH_20720, partial [Pirellula sp.]